MSGSLGSNWLRPLGPTGLTVSAVCVGGAPLGSMPEAFGYEVAENDAVHLVEEVLKSPIRFLDTSNGYSAGRSEERIGKALAASGGLPADFLLATKVDALDGDYSGARVRESVRESKQRLGLDFLPLVHLHDPEFADFADLTSRGGAIDTLVALRDEGEIGHIGVAGGDSRVMQRFLDLGVFEVILTHNRWTLVDRSAGSLIENAIAANVAVINAAIYGGGILTDPNSANPNYGYRPASPETLSAIAGIVEVCSRWGTDLPTAALGWSLRDTRISSTVVGFSKVSRIDSVLEAASVSLPDEFWREVDALVPSHEHWLDAS